MRKFFGLDILLTNNLILRVQFSSSIPLHTHAEYFLSSIDIDFWQNFGKVQSVFIGTTYTREKINVCLLFMAIPYVKFQNSRCSHS